MTVTAAAQAKVAVAVTVAAAEAESIRVESMSQYPSNCRLFRRRGRYTCSRRSIEIRHIR